MTDAGWAHPELLCDTAWLADHRNDADVVVVDCDLLPAYQRLHIPGAVAAPSRYWKGAGTDTDVHGMDDLKRFGELIGAMGIDNTTQVIAYDGSGGLYAARLWWTLDRFGHTACRVLNGGLDAWHAEGRPLTRQPAHAVAKTFVAQPPHDATTCTIDGIREALGDPSVVLWNVRSDGEWSGANARGTQRGERIPGAVRMEWLTTLNEPVRTLKPLAELRRMLGELGITSEKKAITY